MKLVIFTLALSLFLLSCGNYKTRNGIMKIWNSEGITFDHMAEDVQYSDKDENGTLDVVSKQLGDRFYTIYFIDYSEADCEELNYKNQLHSGSSGSNQDYIARNSNRAESWQKAFEDVKTAWEGKK